MSKARDWIQKISEAVTEKPVLTIRGRTVAEVNHQTADCILYESALSENEVKTLIAFLVDQFEETKP